MSDLSFERLREQNLTRAQQWHPGFPNENSWTGGDWAAAMAGECGEACNIVKKLRRCDTGVGAVSHDGRKHEPYELMAKLAGELADVVIYTDLLATKYGIELGAAVRQKFNLVSELRGFKERV